MTPDPPANDCSTNSADGPLDGGIYDLNLPEVLPGEEPLPHRAPSPEALAEHMRLLLLNKPKRSPEERAAGKNPEPFRL